MPGEAWSDREIDLIVGDYFAMLADDLAGQEGLRDLDEVTACAGSHGFVLDRVVDMPANNLSVIFRRS